MQKEKLMNGQESLSMEEYLSRRQEIREKEKRNWGVYLTEEKSPAWLMAELYV